MKSKKSLIIFLCLLLSVTESFSQVDTQNIEGEWRSEDEEKQITISKDREGYFNGKITFDNNDPKSVGKILLKKVVYSENEGNFVGLLTPPGEDMELKVRIYKKSEEILMLVAKKFIFTKTLILKRVKQ